MDLAPYIKSIFGLFFVISLIYITMLVLKRWNSFAFLKNNLNKRVSIEDITYIDSKRKLILIKRDNVEHLILISNDRELVIEEKINFTDSV